MREMEDFVSNAKEKMLREPRITRISRIGQRVCRPLTNHTAKGKRYRRWYERNRVEQREIKARRQRAAYREKILGKELSAHETH